MMADVLSQGEIDALLSALSTGEYQPEEFEKEEEKHKIKVYDFKSPQKFSKDHIRTLELIHENFARIISNYFTGQLRKSVKVKVETVEQISYEEFIHSIQNPTVLALLKMPPLNGTILFEMNSGFSLRIIDRLLGGSGEREVNKKEFSDIDKNIMRQVASDVTSNLKSAWEEVLDISVELDGFETNPALNQTLAPNEPVALISFSVEMGKYTTFINLCIPYLSLEKVLDKLIVQYWVKSEDNELVEEARHKMEVNLRNVNVDIHVDLGNTSLSINDFLKLGHGDVIKLNTRCDEPIKLYVEEEECYYVKPGNIGKNTGVEILDVIAKEVNEDE